MSADPDTRDLPYDPQARRDTPLAMKLKERIGREGPISLFDYWVACHWDAEFGYYSTRKPIGAAGDFTTAPEISQVFGELIGGWAAIVWQQMGAPSSWRLTELGPGRGTMLADALRLMRKVPGLLDGAEVELIEKSKTLAEVQRATLKMPRSAASLKTTWR
jgi:NADH dehydrogenase [ubiquinone] 1 alpha subcomplex assembly factor 7